MIRDIAEAQNSFMHTLYAAAYNVEKGEHHLARLLPQDYPCIHLDEANEHNCIVPKQKRLACMLCGIHPCKDCLVAVNLFVVNMVSVDISSWYEPGCILLLHNTKRKFILMANQLKYYRVLPLALI